MVAKISSPFEIFFANIWVIMRIDITNTINISIENMLANDVMIKNQNERNTQTAQKKTLP